MNLTRCSFLYVKAKKAVSNSTRGSSPLHIENNPVSRYCLIVFIIKSIMNLTHCSFLYVKAKKALSNLTRGSSPLHIENNPVSRYCLIFLIIKSMIIFCKFNSNLILI